MEEPEAGVVITSTDGGEFTVQVRFAGEDSKRDDVTEVSSTATATAVNGVGGGEREKGEASASAVFQEEDPESVSS